MSSDFAREWSLKWAEGVILGFARGRIELNRALGMIRTASKMVQERELEAILANIESNPVYLPSMTSDEKKTKLKPLKEALGMVK